MMVEKSKSIVRDIVVAERRGVVLTLQSFEATSSDEKNQS